MASERPARPARPIPMSGDDNSAYAAWRDACLSCRHSHPKWGCIRLGTVLYSDGSERGFELIPGGCNSWAARDDHD